MSGLFNLLEIGKSSLLAQQAALGVINHNVANANTPGFSRQRLNLSSRTLLGDFYNKAGAGVAVGSVERLSDVLLVGRMGHALGDFGHQNAATRSFDSMELIFGEPTDSGMGENGLGAHIADFMNSWQTVLNPEIDSSDADMRAFILEAGRTLSHRFNSMAEELQIEELSLRGEIDDTVTEVNRLLREVAGVNVVVRSADVEDVSRNDLEDQRQSALLRLSELVGATWETNSDGTLIVYMEGRALVNNGAVHEISYELTGQTSDRHQGARIVMARGGQEIVTDGNRLGGLLRMLNQELPEISGRLDRLAMSVMEQVNAVHQAAGGSEGGGVDIFRGTNAMDMRVNESIVQNPMMISLLGTLPDGREVAQAMFDLHTEPMAAEGGQTIEGFYATMIGELGSKSRGAQQLEESSMRLVEGMEQRLESVSGVNVDEEMANMLVVQSSYQAASKVITLVDEMIDTILNMI